METSVKQKLEIVLIEKTKEIRIIRYDLEKMQVLNSSRKRLYELPINDLIKKKGEMKSFLAPEK